VAISLSIVSVISGAPSREVTREAIPFLFAAFVVLMLITFVPAISLAVPNMLGVK
jgi:C4-dicarboxylate transporter DctM subunit